MSSKIRLVCQATSNGAVRVAEKLREMSYDALKVRDLSRRFVGVILNWGEEGPNGLNSALAIRRARNKHVSFLTWQGTVPVPEFTTVKGNARPWLADGPVLCRTVGGQGGSGITVVRNGEQLVDAQLYVKYVKKQREFRLHFFGGKLIHLQEKKKRNGSYQGRDERIIRSHNNGWVFVENNIEMTPTLRKVLEVTGAKAMSAIGLDFGGLDVILTEDGTNVVVLEVNTRPGLETTKAIAAYAGAIAALADGG